MDLDRWSNELCEFTKKSLHSGNFVPNPDLDGIVFKNIDGRFGYIKTDDAVLEKYRMRFIGEETLIEYPDPESVVANGWVID